MKTNPHKKRAASPRGSKRSNRAEKQPAVHGPSRPPESVSVFRLPIPTASAATNHVLDEMMSVEETLYPKEPKTACAALFAHTWVVPTCSVVVAGHKRVSVYFEFARQKGVFLPLLQNGFELTGHSADLRVLHVTRRCNDRESALAVFEALVNAPLPAPVFRNVSA